MHSIIIPTYKNKEDVSELVKEVQMKSTGDFELITTCEKVSAAKNRNIGLNKASKDSTHIIMIDDDINSLPYGWNEEMIRPMEEDKNIVTVSGRLLNVDGSVGMTMSGNYNTKDPIIFLDHGIAPTACIAFVKSNLRFDEAYVGSGFEDTDFCFQMCQEFPDGKTVINNQVKVVHINEMKEQRGENWEKNKAYFENKWKGYQGRVLQPKVQLKQKDVSLCMIVKNEIKRIKRCLDSAAPYVSEMVIVDTGSTDGTQDFITKHYPNARLIQSTWNDDFASARNIGLEAAKGEWILALDADEELVLEKGPQALQELVNIPLTKPVAYLVRIENIMDGGAQVEHHMARLFKNDPLIKYHGMIHEHLKYDGEDNGMGRMLQVTTVGIKIKHYGYSDNIMAEKDKGVRNVDMLKKEVDADPSSAFYRYHLGITYRVKGQQQEAYEQFKAWDEIVQTLTDNIDLSMGYAAYLGTIISIGNFEEGVKVGKRVWNKCSHNPDFTLNYGILLEHTQDFKEAIKVLQRCIATKGQLFPALSYDRDSFGWKAQAVLGNVYAQLGELQKAIDYWTQGLTEVPDNRDMIKACFTAYMNLGNLIVAEKFLRRLLAYPDQQIEPNNVQLGNIMYNTGRVQEALELFWTLKDREVYVDQLLTGLIAHQQFDKVKEIDDFLQKQKVVA